MKKNSIILILTLITINKNITDSEAYSYSLFRLRIRVCQPTKCEVSTAFWFQKSRGHDKRQDGQEKDDLIAWCCPQLDDDMTDGRTDERARCNA